MDIFGFAISGFLVGIGTKLGNGCTSGHGVCGLPRFSIRSYIAVFVFMLFGFAMSNLKYYFPFLNSVDGENLIKNKINYDIQIPILFSTLILFYICFCIHSIRNKKGGFSDIFVSFFVGFIFSAGLIISGML